MNWYGYVYKTINLLNGKVYIGQRMGSFKSSYHGSGMILKRALILHGVQNFTTVVLSWATDKKELDEFERKHIKAYRDSLPKDMIYNISDGGAGGNTGCHHSEELKKRWSKMRSGKNNNMYGVHLSGKLNHNYGKHHSGETKIKISKANSLHRGKAHGNYGKIRNEETRKKVSESKKGKSPAWNKGRKMSKECCKKISIKAKNRTDLKRNEKGQYVRIK